MDAYESLRAQIEAHIETHGVEEARLRAEIDALRARAAAAEARAAQAETKAERLRALLSTGLEIVDSLSAGYDVWAEQVRAAVEPGAA